MKLSDRFWKHITVVDGCWLWSCTKGYASFKEDGLQRRAHQYSYEKYFGRVSDGLELDHLCRNKNCANPHHLEAVTHRENILRSNTVKNKKSGLPLGVKRSGKKYEAQKCLNGIPSYLGTYSTSEEANIVYQTAIAELINVGEV